MTIDPLLRQLCLTHPAMIPQDVVLFIKTQARQEKERQERERRIAREREELKARGKFLLVAPAKRKPCPRQVREIIARVAERHTVSLRDMTGLARSARVSKARQEAYYELRKDLAMSAPEIGRKFNRDHTSVLHGMWKHALRNDLPQVTRYANSK